MKVLEKDLFSIKETISSFINEHVTLAEQSQDRHVLGLSVDATRHLKAKAELLGFTSLSGKKSWGGAGLSLPKRVMLYEDASQHRSGLFHPAGNAFGEELPRFLEHCSDEQIEKYVKKAVKNGKGCFVAIWDENEDNYLEKLSGTAVKNGEEWVINAHKYYIQKFENSDFGVVLVNCLGEDGVFQPTLFIVTEEDVTAKNESVLIDVMVTHDLLFDGVRIHESRIIGQVGQGIQLINQWLTDSQILLAARCLGVAKKALEHAQEYSKTRITRGKPLAEFASIRTMIAEGHLNLNAAKIMVHDAARKVEANEEDAIISAKMAKLFTTDVVSKIIDDTLQIHGGAGFAGDLPIERWYKEIRVARLTLQKKEIIHEEIAYINLQ